MAYRIVAIPMTLSDRAMHLLQARKMRFLPRDASATTVRWHRLHCFYRASYASAVLGVVILSVRPSLRHTRALWLTKEPTGDIFIPHERAIILVF